jgi:hypothetical protein
LSSFQGFLLRLIAGSSYRRQCSNRRSGMDIKQVLLCRKRTQTETAPRLLLPGCERRSREKRKDEEKRNVHVPNDTSQPNSDQSSYMRSIPFPCRASYPRIRSVHCPLDTPSPFATSPLRFGTSCSRRYP